MTWDHRHRRTAGFAVTVLRPVGVYGILAMLSQTPHMHPVDMLRLLRAADAEDAPMVGSRGFDLPAVSHRVSSLRRAGLIVRCAGHAGLGGHAAYDLTRLGAGLVGSLSSSAVWGMRYWELAVAAARMRLGLPESSAAADSVVREPRRATGLALGMLDMRWAWAMLGEVHVAGAAGVESAVAQNLINAAVRALPEQARYVMAASTRHAVLRYLEDAGLVVRWREPRFARPARVLLATTVAGAELMDALWPLAEWGVEHEKQLTEMMMSMTTWFAPSAS